jgi:hypothetical protein
VADDFWEAPPAGGGGPLGLVAAAGVSAVSANLSVRKVFKPSTLGDATATASLKIRRPMVVAVAGTASFATALTVARVMAAAVGGQTTVSIVFGSITPAPTISIGPVIVVGQSEASCFTTIYRDLGSGVASGGSASLSVSLYVNEYVGVNPGPRASVSALTRQLRELISDHREAAKRAEGEVYSGIINPDTTHEEWPGIPLEDFDQYELAELVRQQEYADQKSDYESQIRVRDQALELAQRRLRIQTNRPQGLPRPPARDRLVKDILDKREREANWRAKANMARVRSFKKH